MNTTLAQPSVPDLVADNDLKLLEIIARFSAISQRDLANHSGLSLGMVNLVIKRLVKTGYIQITNLSQRKMRYFLTPQGLAMKSRRAYDYLNRTIRIYETYREHIHKIIHDQNLLGRNKFVIHGEGDIVDLVKVVLAHRQGIVSYRVCSPAEEAVTLDDELLLICYLPDKRPLHGISVLEAILNIKSETNMKETLHA